MECCMSTDVGTWANWLTFEPDLDHSPDAGTRLLSPISYKRCNAAFYYVGKISRICIGRLSLQQCVVLKWFYLPRAVGTSLSEVQWYMRSIECPSSLCKWWECVINRWIRWWGWTAITTATPRWAGSRGRWWRWRSTLITHCFTYSVSVLIRAVHWLII